jgi:GNAT superfamily N-acetyltransferase
MESEITAIPVAGGPLGLTVRPGTLADSRAVFDVFQAAISDLGERLNMTAISGGRDPAVLEGLWRRRRPMVEHLARTAEHFWVAEKAGAVIGYARSILRGDVRQLTEFFVLPGFQSAGLGRALLARAFPASGARMRFLLGTADQRAVARYLKAGVYPVGVAGYFDRQPRAVRVESDLVIDEAGPGADTVAAFGAIDAVVLGFRRDEEHAFLLTDRRGLVYSRGGQVVGYGYIGDRNGPFALLDASDYPAVLAHAEQAALARGEAEFGVELPLNNRAAVAYLLEQRFEMGPFVEYIFTDGPFGRLENYMLTSPPWFL